MAPKLDDYEIFYNKSSLNIALKLSGYYRVDFNVESPAL